MYVVETQRTRAREEPENTSGTVLIRFGEFDILTVATEPSTKRWDTFMYTVARWWVPRPDQTHLLLKFQPVSPTPNNDRPIA